MFVGCGVGGAGVAAAVGAGVGSGVVGFLAEPPPDGVGSGHGSHPWQAPNLHF